LSVLKKHVLTKSKIMSGLQCTKKLWFDVNSPIRIESHILYIGNRFGDFSRKYYGTGLNLNGISNLEEVLEETSRGLLDPNVNVIYEGAFVYEGTLIRSDVLLRNSDAWDLIEIKSSTSLKLEHIKDAAIQAYIIEKSGIKIKKVKIGHINNQFIYLGDENYKNFLIESDISDQVELDKNKVAQWIDELSHLAINGTAEPLVSMGVHCAKPHKCQYQERCNALLPKFDGVPISIIPYIGKKLSEKWNEKGIHDLRDLPQEVFDKPIYQTIQKAHQENIPWVSYDLKKEINSMGWPRYFMDFEAAQQGVPKLLGTKAYDPLPFQWSVHKWVDIGQNLTLDNGQGYLDFFSPSMDKDFLKSLLEVLGDVGPIFVHSAPYEITVLKNLCKRPNCKEYEVAVANVIERIVDTRELAKSGFYAPEMMGSYSLKDIVKAVPETVNFYNHEGLSGGGDAQIAWFKCTDPEISKLEKDEWIKKLKNYCSQDTLAMYHFIKFIINYDNENIN
jgi:predicted RecB family nuclease